MKVYIVCEYSKLVDREVGTERLELEDIHAVTVDRYLAELIRDALQYKHDLKKGITIFKIREFKVYGIV